MFINRMSTTPQEEWFKEQQYTALQLSSVDPYLYEKAIIAEARRRALEEVKQRIDATQSIDAINVFYVVLDEMMLCPTSKSLT